MLPFTGIQDVTVRDVLDYKSQQNTNATASRCVYTQASPTFDVISTELHR